jgi:hypothetical protein
MSLTNRQACAVPAASWIATTASKVFTSILALEPVEGGEIG